VFVFHGFSPHLLESPETEATSRSYLIVWVGRWR
jgi:hypothetical protein